jgi:hypothetical protein
LQHKLSRAGLFTGLALLVSLITGCQAATVGPVVASAPATPSNEIPEAPPATVVPDIPLQSTDPAIVQAGEKLAPVRLTIAELKINMPVLSQGLASDGQMALPELAAETGWYKYGAGLGEAQGSVVVAGHLDSSIDGAGPLVRLNGAVPGTIISLTGSDGSQWSYRVTDIVQIPKVKNSLDEYFDAAAPARLVLITCGGRWEPDLRTYSDNTVLLGEPVAR